MRVATLIVAAGRGKRAESDIPKQYRLLGGRTVLARTVDVFLEHDGVETVLVAIHPDDEERYARSVSVHGKLLPPVHGGSTRSESVFNGLRALSDTGADTVLIHDAARPFVSGSLIERTISALGNADGAVPVLPAVDAMRRIESDGSLGKKAPRDGIGRVQTPQGFHLASLLQAYEKSKTSEALDDAEIALEAGMHVVAVPGDPANFKLTIPEDFAMAERLVSPAMRVGQGFDVHAFGEGGAVMLCGIKVPHTQSLMGHSDADVGLHAITDALLGAVGRGDIGQHFPPSDPQWKAADSAVFLSHAVGIVAEAGYGIGNLDVTLICEAPKIGPHAEAMRKRIGEICGIGMDQVSVKATTTERLGFCGRGEGIAAQAVATVARLS